MFLISHVDFVAVYRISYCESMEGVVGMAGKR